MVDMEKLTSGSNMLKQSRLHGDMNQNVRNLFTKRVAEIATMRRLIGVIQDEDLVQKPAMLKFFSLQDNTQRDLLQSIRMLRKCSEDDKDRTQ